MTSTLPPLCLKTAAGQNAVDEAAIACALERYRLARGKLPATLDELAPRFLGRVPLDVCNGKPLIYHREAEQEFVLYSVGWNETDDGGKIVMEKGGDNKVALKQGDWVWPKYPAR